MPDIDRMWEGVREAASVRRVYGEPYEQNGTTVIPVAAVRGGGGGGGDTEGNGGGGFGVLARPVGAYVVGGDGEVRWRPAVDVSRIVLGWQIVALLTLLAGWSLGRRLTRGS